MWKCENMANVKMSPASGSSAAGRWKSAVCALAALAALATFPSKAAPIPWKTPAYTLVARDMELRDALDTFAVAEGLSVVMSQSVAGTFSGDFKDVPPSEFLDKLATTHNLIWYYDGAALYLYGAGEVATLLIDLQYMKAAEVREMLAELGVEDARFPLKTTSNDELIMVSGPPRYVSLVAEMIAKADKLREVRTFNEVETRIFPLVNTWADDVSFRVASPESTATIKGVARLLEEIMSVSGSGKTHEAVLTNEVSAAEASISSTFRPIIRPENRLNAVIVRDVVSRLPMYETLIKQLDVPQKLIEITVTTVEMSQKDALDWQLSLAGSGRHGHSSYGAGQNPDNIFSPDALVGKGLAGSLTHIHSAYSLYSSLTALREKGKARNISRTSLLTVNNFAAEMTDSQSYHARVVGTEVATLEEVTAGTKLQIKPRIIPAPGSNTQERIWLSLRLDDGGFEAVAVDSMPMTRSSSLQTQTAIYEDESIMLAGYLKEIEESGGWGIPYLRDIPWIGWIFGGATVHKETIQRLFILSPRVIDIDTDMVARLQATRIRDMTVEEQLAEDADRSAEEKRERELERENRSEIRSERLLDSYNRRSAEIEHEKTMRTMEREKRNRRLSEDIKKWREEEAAARQSLAEAELEKQIESKPAESDPPGGLETILEEQAGGEDK